SRRRRWRSCRRRDIQAGPPGSGRPSILGLLPALGLLRLALRRQHQLLGVDAAGNERRDRAAAGAAHPRRALGLRPRVERDARGLVLAPEARAAPLALEGLHSRPLAGGSLPLRRRNAGTSRSKRLPPEAALAFGVFR